MSTSPLPLVQLRPFTPDDQDAAKQLILAGLGDRWGWIDPTRNPDLDAIAQAYADGCFLVAEQAGELIATGALLPEGAGVMRVVRMSVRRDLRGQGIGKRILAALLTAARDAGCTQVVLETTSTWTDAVAFYRRSGFRVVDVRDGETHMMFPLD